MTCQYGSEPKAGADKFFTYVENDLVTWLPMVGGIPGLLAGWLTKALIGLPDGPQETAVFCATPPPDELPTAADYALLGMPFIGGLVGTYRRFGNQVKAGMWNDLCQCKLTPGGAAWYTVGTFTGNATAWGNVNNPPVINVGFIPSDVTRIRGTFISTSCPNGKAHLGVATGGPLSPTGCQWDAGQCANAGWMAGRIGVGQSQERDLTTYSAADRANMYLHVLACNNCGDRWMTVEDSWTWLIEYFAPRQTQPPPPPLPAAPDGFPAAPACPTVTDTQGLADLLCQLGRKIDVLDDKVDWLANLQNPSQAIPDDEPTPVTDPTSPITKPPTAIGVIVGLTVPPGIGHYGQNPGAVMFAAHAALGTNEGWLPSVPLKHLEQLVLPIPPQVTRVGLDLAPGVSATMRWLYPPK